MVFLSQPTGLVASEKRKNGLVSPWFRWKRGEIPLKSFDGSLPFVNQKINICAATESHAGIGTSYSSAERGARLRGGNRAEAGQRRAEGKSGNAHREIRTPTWPKRPSKTCHGWTDGRWAGVRWGRSVPPKLAFLLFFSGRFPPFLRPSHVARHGWLDDGLRAGNCCLIRTRRGRDLTWLDGGRLNGRKDYIVVSTH
jgi:hypothetical protein